MTTITKHLSINSRDDGKHQIYLWVYVSRHIRYHIKSKIYVSTDIWDEQTKEIIIPKRSRYNYELVKEAELQKLEADAYITRIKTIICTGPPNNAKNSRDWRRWTMEVLSLQDDPEINLKRDNLSKKDIDMALEAYRAKIAAKEKAANRLTLTDALYLYFQKNKLSVPRVKGLKGTAKMTTRFVTYNRIMKNKEYNLYVDNMTAADLEDLRNYILEEPLLARQDPVLFRKIISLSPANARPRSLKGRGYNYAIDVLKRIKAVYNWLVRTSRTNNNPFVAMSLGQEVYGTPFYLTSNERNQITDYDLSQKSEMLQTQRDIFVFHCLVGCRYGDLSRLTKNNINNGVLSYVPAKTRNNNNQITPRVPLNEVALRLIEKYRDNDKHGRLFPFVSAQQYNKKIKEVLTICKIMRPVMIRDPTTGVSVFKPINEVASSHMARRTFVGSLYKIVKDPDLIGAMSGHAPGSKSFARYRAIDDNDLIDIIKKI